MPTTKFTTLANLDRYTTHVEEKNIQVTRDEYTKLPSSKLTDNRSYFIKDEGIVIKNGVEYGGNSAGDTTYTLSVGTGADADKIVLTPSSGTPNAITVPYAINAASASNASSVSGHTVATDVPADAVFTDTTYENATTAVAGLMSTDDKSKLDGIASGAEVNQNTFSNIVANGTTVSADSKTDTLTIEAGSNVTITGDATNDKITISATDTTYSDATTATHGLMSTTDKSKLDGIAAGAEVNVQANWTETNSSADAYIKNKPTLGTAAAKDVPATGNASTSQVVMGNDTRLTDARNAADVYSWAKASTKPTYSYSEITNTPTIPTITDTYSGTSSDGMSGKAVKSAIDALDGTITGSAGAGKTLTALSQTDGKVSATFGNISITKSQISDFPSLGNAAVKNYTTSVTNGSNDLVTSGAVWTAIDNLPEPMVFKGSLGTGGTITALPVNGSATIGDTYKVITAGTYASKVAKVGDTFICLTKTSSANTWELIPSGDEPNGTVTSVGVSNGGGLSVSGSPVTTSGTITISHADTSSQASVNNSGRTYIQDITLDTYGHVTGIASATETVTNTDRYVNSASFAHDSTNNNVKMTLTRAGSDTATVTGNIPKVSSSSAGVAPKGAAVSSQTQATKFLREDGTWAKPSYTTNTNTTYTFANGTNGFTVTPSGGSAQTVTVTPSFTVTTGDSDGQVKVNGTNASVKGLGSAAYNNTSAFRLTNGAGVWTCSGQGQNNYFRIATITIGSSYVNGPILFHLGGRGYLQTNLIIRFQSVSGTDPSVDFIQSDNYQGYYIRKTSTSNWEVIGQYNESWGRADLYYVENYSVSVTVKMENIGKTLPDGCTQATRLYASPSDISTLQSNFQAGVDSVYDAIVARGTTPASKSLSDVVTGIGNIQTTHTGTYKPTSRASNCDMGATHSYRYVNTTAVPNSNSGTYTPAGNAIYDMGATNDKRYCDGRTAYSAGYAAKRSELTATYKPTSRATGLDMGSNHTYRYVNTTSVPNTNSGTYAVTSNGVKDMGADNTQRYVNVSVPNSNSGTQTITANGTTDMGATNDKRYVSVNVANSNSGTYTFAENDTGGIKDMGSTNDKRYVVATNVYNKGKADGKADHSGTYKPTTRASNCDMGSVHSYRYVNTTEVPNSNSGTYSITSNGIKDMTATNTYRYANVNVPNTNSGTYAVTSNGIKDMGSDNAQRYVNVNVPNSNSGTASYDSNGIKDMGAANSYRYVNINVPHPTHTTTYTPTSRASNCDMGSVHSYRYVDTRSVPNSNSGTYTPAGNAIYDMGATNDKRYCDGRTAYTAGYNAKVATLTGTYKPTSRASNLDMGSNHTYRYVNTNDVPNSNSGTYGSVTSNGIKDMGATNSYRYVNVNVPNSNSGTYTYASGSTGGTVDMGAANSYRYVNATNVYNKGKADGAGDATLSFVQFKTMIAMKRNTDPDPPQSFDSYTYNIYQNYCLFTSSAPSNIWNTVQWIQIQNGKGKKYVIILDFGSDLKIQENTFPDDRAFNADKTPGLTFSSWTYAIEDVTSGFSITSHYIRKAVIYMDATNVTNDDLLFYISTKYKASTTTDLPFYIAQIS